MTHAKRLYTRFCFRYSMRCASCKKYVFILGFFYKNDKTLFFKRTGEA